MLDVTNIHSLTDFNRNTKEHVERLKTTGEPQVLTVNGKAAVVVQDAEAYQKLIEQADLGESVRVLRERLESRKRGQKRIPMRQALEDFAREVGVELKK